MMTSFSSENAILIESPEGGQNGQFRAKNGQFYKLNLLKNDEMNFLQIISDDSS